MRKAVAMSTRVYLNYRCQESFVIMLLLQGFFSILARTACQLLCLLLYSRVKGVHMRVEVGREAGQLIEVVAVRCALVVRLD